MPVQVVGCKSHRRICSFCPAWPKHACRIKLSPISSDSSTDKSKSALIRLLQLKPHVYYGMPRNADILVECSDIEAAVFCAQYIA